MSAVNAWQIVQGDRVLNAARVEGCLVDFGIGYHLAVLEKRVGNGGMELL